MKAKLTTYNPFSLLKKSTSSVSSDYTSDDIRETKIDTKKQETHQ